MRSVRWKACWRSGHFGLPHLQVLLETQLLRVWERHCSAASSPIRWSWWLEDRGNQSHSRWLVPIVTTAIQMQQGSLEIAEHSAQLKHPAFPLDARRSLAMFLARTWQEKRSQIGGSTWPRMDNGKGSGEGETVSPHCCQLSHSPLWQWLLSHLASISLT